MMKKETQVGVRMDAALVARARKKAKAEHRSLSDAIRKLVEDWLRQESRAA